MNVAEPTDPTKRICYERADSSEVGCYTTACYIAFGCSAVGTIISVWLIKYTRDREGDKGGGGGGGGGSSGGHAAMDLDARLDAGTHVRMQHLTNHASLNNRRGVVRRYDVKLRRYVVTVRVGDAEVEHAVRAENLVAR